MAQDRKVSFEFERDILGTKTEGPATLTKINLKPVGEDGVDLPDGQTAEKRTDVPSLELDPTAKVADTTTDNPGDAPDGAIEEEKAVPDEEEEEEGAGSVPSNPHDGLTVSTTNPELTMEDEFAMTEEILGRSVSPSMKEAYERHLKDMKQRIAEEQRYLNMVRVASGLALMHARYMQPHTHVHTHT